MRDSENQISVIMNFPNKGIMNGFFFTAKSRAVSVGRDHQFLVAGLKYFHGTSPPRYQAKGNIPPLAR